MTKVLTVEDDLDQLRLIDIYLRRSGRSVEPVASAEAAIALLDRGETYEVAIVDVYLSGMSGIEFAAILRRRQPNCRVILTSVDDRGNTASPEALLPKPYTRAEIVDLIDGAPSARLVPGSRPAPGR